MTRKSDLESEMEYNKSLLQVKTIDKENRPEDKKKEQKEWGFSSQMRKI